jgi:hypothetical protein
MKLLIAGLDKAQVLLALYNHAYYEGSGGKDYDRLQRVLRSIPRATLVAAQKEILLRTISNDFKIEHIDLNRTEKLLNVDLGTTEFDSADYDHLHGSNLAQRVIHSLRVKKVSCRHDHASPDYNQCGHPDPKYSKP